MADVDLTLGTLNKGILEEEFQSALGMINDSMANTKLVGKPREITIKIKMVPDENGYVMIESSTTTKIPVVSVSGIAWQQTSGAPFATNEFKGEDRRQTEFSLPKSTVVSITPMNRNRD